MYIPTVYLRLGWLSAALPLWPRAPNHSRLWGFGVAVPLLDFLFSYWERSGEGTNQHVSSALLFSVNHTEIPFLGELPDSHR
jgi:hypothetical protein